MQEAFDSIGQPIDFKHTFRLLADRWYEETMNLSSIQRMQNNKNFQAIMSMRQFAIPHIFNEIATKGGHWYGALAELTGANPVKEENRGRIEKMKEDWLDWGKKNGWVE